MALSAAAIVFIILGALLLAYFVVGSLVRYQGGLRHCPEVLPNYQFWCGLANVLLRAATCGRYRISTIRDSRIGGLSVLPSRPHVARDVQFEALPSGGDDEWEDSRGMQPAEVVVRL